MISSHCYRAPIRRASRRCGTGCGGTFTSSAAAGWRSFAIAAADVALWDLAGKRAGQPLWRMLGGANDRVMAYAGGIDLQFTLDALLTQSDDFRARGFHAIKMKLGRDRLSEDVARVAAMREHLGDDFPLLADANMRWRVDQACVRRKACSRTV